MQSAPSPKKSSSLGTIASNEPQSSCVINHDEIIALTRDVKNFSDSLAQLKILFTEGTDPEEDVRVVIHEGLGEVLSVLNPVMQKYPDLQSPDIFSAARSLITMIKDYDYEADMSLLEVQGFCEAIDQLALAFSSSVSEYLMGDMGPQMVMNLKTKSMNNVSVPEEVEPMDDEDDSDAMSTDDLDGFLVRLDSGLTIALQRAKVWSKYMLDIITYIEKKTQIEMDYAKNLSRLAHNMQNNLRKEGYLPLQSVYCTALTQDVDFASNLQATHAVLHTHKFVEPLTVRRTEHEKVYKSVKEVWNKEYRRMSDSVTNLRKAQAAYLNRQQEYEKAKGDTLKAEGDKVEKRRKAEEEASHKAAETETTYKACVAEANYRQQEFFKVKKEQLVRVREEIQLCDQVIKSVTVEYFQLYHTVISPIPLQYQTLSESSKTYENGRTYKEYMKRLPMSHKMVTPELFVFEPFIHGLKASPLAMRKGSLHSNGSVTDPSQSPDVSPRTSPRRDKYRIPLKAWGQQGGASDTDSASLSSKSHESSPSGSPHRASRRILPSQSLDQLTEEELLAAAAQPGKEKKGHMKRTMTVDGEENLHIPELLMQHRGRRNTTFGVDFQEQVNTFQTKVPPIVSLCLTEIERRGVMIKGIYRVSGVKSKVEHLCQRFDLDPESVDLEDVHPNIISNVLKLYLRQLPEPLLTFRLYSDFIYIAKENMSGELSSEGVVSHLRSTVCRLPSSNLRTTAVIMHHLHRVAANSDVNQMSASNLGIVFGPTLLRPLEGSASLASLVDTPHQTRAVELLVTYAPDVFGPSEDFQAAPSQTPVETLDHVLDGVLIPGKSLLDHPRSNERPISSESDISGDHAMQASSSDYLLPGSTERDNPRSLSSPDSDSGLPDVLVEYDEETTDDLLLPDQSKPHSDPLSVVLSARCIAEDSGPRTKMTVPKSASSPQVSRRSPTSHMTSSSSAPGAADAPGSTLTAAFSNAAAGVKDYLLPSTTSLPVLASTGAIKDSEIRLEEKLGGDNKQVVDDLGKTLGGEGRVVVEGGVEVVMRDKQRQQDDLAKKRAHSQQLENIKFLTKPPSDDETADKFYPKINLVASPALVPRPDADLKKSLTISPSSDPWKSPSLSPVITQESDKNQSKKCGSIGSALFVQVNVDQTKEESKSPSVKIDSRASKDVANVSSDPVAQVIVDQNKTAPSASGPNSKSASGMLKMNTVKDQSSTSLPQTSNVTVGKFTDKDKSSSANLIPLDKEKYKSDDGNTGDNNQSPTPKPVNSFDLKPPLSTLVKQAAIKKVIEDKPSVSEPVAKLPQFKKQGQDVSSRKSILEEVPQATVSSPTSETLEKELTSVRMVTLPASPTIRRREMNKPTVKKVQEHDKACDSQFRLKQRKLVMAIKSASTDDPDYDGGESKPPSGLGKDIAKGKEIKQDEKRKSGGFDESVFSGGCALSSAAGRHPFTENKELHTTKPDIHKPTLRSESPVSSHSSSSSQASLPPTHKSGVKVMKREGQGSPRAKPIVRKPGMSMPSTVFTRKPASASIAKNPNVSTGKAATSLTKPLASPTPFSSTVKPQSSDQGSVSSKSSSTSSTSSKSGSIVGKKVAIKPSESSAVSSKPPCSRSTTVSKSAASSIKVETIKTGQASPVTQSPKTRKTLQGTASSTKVPGKPVQKKTSAGSNVTTASGPGNPPAARGKSPSTVSPALTPAKAAKASPTLTSQASGLKAGGTPGAEESGVSTDRSPRFV